jgi:hypothetical protein
VNEFERARQQYRPSDIKYLFVAEAPPKAGSARFFYFPRVATGDSLFLETMKALYPRECTCAADIRPRKVELLRKFMNDGFFLLDAVDSPLTVKGTAAKVREIRKHVPILTARIHACLSHGTGVILISATVFEACAPELQRAGIPLMHDEPIPFPGSGQQAKFQDRMQRQFPRRP